MLIFNINRGQIRYERVNFLNNEEEGLDSASLKDFDSFICNDFDRIE